MKQEQLWENYPVLYHMAWEGSWPSIKDNGLLSSKALLELYEKNVEEIKKLTQNRREHWVEIFCPNRPTAVLRDQKPLTDAGLRRALEGTAEPWQWYDLINSMVFFWPTKERLRKMLSASAYKSLNHDVLVVNTKKLVQMECENIRLSRLNSGCTKPMPWPRDLSLFKQFEDYPFEERIRRAGKSGAIAEVCVQNHVEQIDEVVIDVLRGSSTEIIKALSNHR